MENNLNNLPPFYVGQKVVYITGINMPKDSIHTIKRINVCSCGTISIDVNKSWELEKRNICNCNMLIEKNNCIWYDSNSFRPLQESVFPSLTMSKVLEKESQLISMN